MNQRLKDTNVVILGGSRGIGRTVVKKLAAEGANVLFTYVGNEAAAKETAEAARMFNENITYKKIDLTKAEDIDKLFSYASNTLKGKPDIYLGIAFPQTVFKPIEQVTNEDYDAMFYATKGHFFAMQNAVKNLSNNGKIIVYSSGSASYPSPASGLYGGSKSAIESFALGLSKEVGDRGITVNVVSPGVTQTDGLVAPQEMIDMLVQSTPLGRLGTTQDVANATVQLCMPEMSWVNGQVIQVNGGIL